MIPSTSPSGNLPSPRLPWADLVLRLGRYGAVPVASAEEASRVWQLFRDGLCLSGSDSPTALLQHNGMTVGYVSYNGRVWKGRPTGKSYLKPPVAEAALVEGVREGDWLYAENLLDEVGGFVRVIKVHEADRAITVEDPVGKLCDRAYLRERFEVNAGNLLCCFQLPEARAEFWNRYTGAN